MPKEKLFIDLKPKSLWGKFSNNFDSTAWKIISQTTIGNAQGCCELCDTKCDDLLVEPRWETSVEKRERTLRKLMAICKDCENVIHFGRSKLRGLEKNATKHLQVVTGFSDLEVKTHIEDAFKTWRDYCELEKQPGFFWREKYSFLEKYRI